MTNTKMILTENDFSQSEMTTLDACGQKWYWQYGRMLKRIGMWNWFFAVGGSLHTFLEHHYQRRLTPADYEFKPEIGDDVLRTPDFLSKKEFWEIVFPAYCKAYRMLYPSDPFTVEPEGVEILACREYRGLNFRGKIDLLGNYKKDVFIGDHKTTFRLDILGPQMKQKFQFPFYFWLSGIPEGSFLCNQIKKPAQRQGKKETTREFAQRVAHEILDEPIKYFQRDWCYFSKEDMQRFQEKFLDPKVDTLLKILEGKPEDSHIWNNRAQGNCFSYNTPCAFQSLCYEDEALADIEYEAKSSKHEELEEESVEE